MDDVSELAQGADPEVVEVEEGQVATPTAEAEPETPEAAEEKKSAASERRERDKAYKARLVEERDKALAEVKALKDQREKVLKAGSQEKPPTDAEFSDPFELSAQRAAYLADQRLTQRNAGAIDEAVGAAEQRAQDIAAAEAKWLSDNWTTQASEAVTRYADFDVVIGKPGLFPQGKPFVSIIQSSDVAADVAYAIASDRPLHDRLAAMSPVEAAREIGRLEATLSRPKPRMETKAPQPINPVKGGASVGKDPLKMDANEFASWRAGGGTFA